MADESDALTDTQLLQLLKQELRLSQRCRGLLLEWMRRQNDKDTACLRDSPCPMPDGLAYKISGRLKARHDLIELTFEEPAK